MNVSTSPTITITYRQQVEALTEGARHEKQGSRRGVLAALDDFCRAANIDSQVRNSMCSAIEDGAALLKTVWAETGGCPDSLFAFLPGCQHCLTQAKSAYGLGAESDWFVDNLGLLDNQMVPTAPERITADMLPEFARLQTDARRLAR